MGLVSLWVSPPLSTWGGLLAQSGLLKNSEGILSQPYYPLLLSWGMGKVDSTPEKVAIGAKTQHTLWLSPRSFGLSFETIKLPSSPSKKGLICRMRSPSLQSMGGHGRSPSWTGGSLVEKVGHGTKSLQLRRQLTKGKVISKCRQSFRSLGRLMCVRNSGSIYEEDEDALKSAKSTGGQISREVLYSQGRIKMDYTPDADFYSFPRFVTHVDAAFLRKLTNLYRERLPPGGEILDLMSSWVSHLPPEISYRRVIGHGMNALELSKNKDLTEFFVKDLNQQPKLERADKSVDAVICTVSVQYLQQPEKIFAEIYRVLRPGGVCIITFSNRMFYQKAIASWRDGTMYSRTQLVKQYFQCITGFTEPEVIREVQSREPVLSSNNNSNNNKKTRSFLTQSKQVLEKIATAFQNKTSGDPFVAVVAYRNFRPVHDHS